MSGAANHRGSSKQDYSTPQKFIETVVKRFGPIAWDLAANSSNAVSQSWYGPGGVSEDSLAQDWTQLRGNLWLNPPFGNIAPWAAKCAASRTPHSRILFLVPASVGSNWFAEYVAYRAKVFFLSPRLSFDGKNYFPKDCMLCVYDLMWSNEWYECWRWKP